MISSFGRRCLFAASTVLTAFAEEKPRELLEMKNEPEKRVTPTSKLVAVTRAEKTSGVVVSIQPGGESYPGVSVKPPQGMWDLSKHGHIEARVANLGSKPARISLRVDNEGPWQDNPYNTETAYLEPGESASITTIFGFSFGGKPGFKLKPGVVSGILIFATKSGEAQAFRIDGLHAGGPVGEKPPPDPDEIRIAPENGVLLGVAVKPKASQVVANGGAEASVTPEGRVKIAFSGKDQRVSIMPAQGRWDLRSAHQVKIAIRNSGKTAIRPTACVESDAGGTDKASFGKPVASGGRSEIVVSFIPANPWTGIKNLDRSDGNGTEGTGTKFTSDAVRRIAFFSSEEVGAQEFEIESVTASAPAAVLPDWLGKRPPVPGDWVQTFNEEFSGNAVDLRKWNVHAPNHWDQLSHFSKDNVIVKGGVARLHYEKKTGRHNDDPAGKETPYATGFLDTYGKWVQRYGYFEARMKLPKAPGLWPAFWLMPDRGLAAGEQWDRASTNRGGMEFDIMEFLSRWGVYRYNIAFHWDGYQDGHKQTGTTTIYTAADKDGFITSGLLWLPGQAVLYSNGAVVARWESPRVSSVESDIMFTHVMGGWDNSDLDDGSLPDDFVIDYVRCWQRKDLASAVDGVKSTEPSLSAPNGK